MSVFLLALLLGGSAGAAPGPVVERVVDLGRETIRLSLFDNRVALVAVREGAEPATVTRLTLDEDEYVGYLSALTIFLESAVPADETPPWPTPGRLGTIVIHAGTGPPRRVVYRVGEVLDLATGRLVSALDDLERRVRESLPSEETLRGWEPELDDVVELATGARARVIEVREDGVILLQHLHEGLIDEVPASERARFIRRVVEEAK